jgi:ferredoxin
MEINMKRNIIKIDEEKCNGCGECEKRCPYGLPIRDMLQQIRPEPLT